MQKKVFGLIGKSLSHSFSESYFNKKFEKESIFAEYKNYEIEDISTVRNVISENSLFGLNVTIPYKESVIPFLDSLNDTAKEIGAVNCIKVSNQNPLTLVGYNTDEFGFKQSIKPFLESSHTNALILGKGGASKAVAYVLKNLGIKVFYAVRNEEIKNEYTFLFSDLNQAMLSQIPLIINTTPIGTFPQINEFPPIPMEFIGINHFLIDLIYNPSETYLLKLAKKNGALTLNGWSMLQQQAEKSWEIWNG